MLTEGKTNMVEDNEWQLDMFYELHDIKNGQMYKPGYSTKILNKDLG